MRIVDSVSPRQPLSALAVRPAMGCWRMRYTPETGFLCSASCRPDTGSGCEPLAHVLVATTREAGFAGPVRFFSTRRERQPLTIGSDGFDSNHNPRRWRDRMSIESPGTNAISLCARVRILEGEKICSNLDAQLAKVRVAAPQ